MLDHYTLISRYSYVANVRTICHHLPSCDTCHYGMRNNPHFLIQDIHCDKCDKYAKWNLMSGSPLMRYAFPNKHPMKRETSTDKIRAKEVIFRFLKKTVEPAINI